MWLIIALVAIWGTVLVAWLVSWVLAIARARDVGTIRYRQSRSDVRKGTIAVVFCVVVVVLFFRLSAAITSKYPPAEPGALVLEPLEAACPCCFNSAALLRRGMSQHHVSVTISLTSSLGRQRLHNCITAPRSGASAFKPSIYAVPFVCLDARWVAAMERGASTPGYVKLLLPPRRSRGNSHFGLAEGTLRRRPSGKEMGQNAKCRSAFTSALTNCGHAAGSPAVAMSCVDPPR